MDDSYSLGLVSDSGWGGLDDEFNLLWIYNNLGVYKLGVILGI